MAEGAAPDIAEKPTPLNEGVRNYILQQAQPQSFLEHPATGMIPVVGPILNAFGAVNQHRRVVEAAQKATLFNTLVKEGDFDESVSQYPALQGIPQPIIDAGLLESQKVRQTYAYQYRKAFSDFINTETPYPSERYVQEPNLPESGMGYRTQAETVRTGMGGDERAQALQTWLRNHPEAAAAQGNPELGRIAIENRLTGPVLAAAEQAGIIPSKGTRGAVSPTQPTQTPLQPAQLNLDPTADPAWRQGVERVYRDYESGKTSDKDLDTAVSTIPGMSQEAVKESADNLRAIKQQNLTRQEQSATSQVDPLGQFNPRKLGGIASFDLGFSAGKASLTMKSLSVQDRAAAYLLHHTLQNPTNFQAALADITNKGVPLDPKQVEFVQQQATAPTLIANYKRNLRAMNPQAAGAQAVLDTAQNFNITDPKKTEELLNIIKDPAVVQGIMSEVQTRGQQTGLGGTEADIVRQKEAAQAAERERLVFSQKSQDFYTTPLNKLPNGEGLAIADNLRVSDTSKSLEELQKGGLIFMPKDIRQEFVNTQQAINIVGYLKRLYLATNPTERGAVGANIRGFFQTAGAPLGLNEPVRNYTEALDAFSSRLGSVAPTPGVRVNAKLLEGYRDFFPKSNRITPQGTKKFDDVIEQLSLGYNLLKQMYDKQGTTFPTLEHGGAHPEIDKQIEQGVLK